MLIRSRDSLAHLWLPRRVLQRGQVSVELQAPALFPGSVATATGTHVSSHAALVCAFFVLELETELLSIPLEYELFSVLLDQVIKPGSFAFALPFSFGSSTLLL